MRDDIVLNDRARALSDELVKVLEMIYDPDLELDMYNLGLVYAIEVDEAEHCKLTMTFTDGNCGCAETMPIDVVDKLTEIEGIKSANVEIVWSPAWTTSRISRYGRIALGIRPRE